MEKIFNASKLLFGLCFAITLLLCQNKLQAQTAQDDSPCKDFQDLNSITAPIIKNKDGKFGHGKSQRAFATYRFLRSYDSCNTSCLFSLFKINQSIIRLLNFCVMKKRIEWDTDSLRNANSLTEDFTLRSGDTISFFRRFNWYNPITDGREYSSLDTLSYSVELVSTGTKQRVALLDSISVAKQLVSGKPNISAMHPVISGVAFVVPDSLHNKTCFIRINSYQKGEGIYAIIRKDEIVQENLAKAFETPYFKDFLKEFGSYNKITLEENISIAKAKNKPTKN